MFPALDTLRFVGAAFVVVTHVAFQTGNYSHGLVGAIAARLDVGVAIFFVLSGFLLSSPYFAALEDHRPPPATGWYFWHRLLRIAPLYVLTVVLALTLLPPARGPFWPHWVQNLTLTTIYGDDPLPEGLTQMWSLATEVAFYVVLPGIMALVIAASRRIRTNLVIGLTLAVMVAVNIGWYLDVAWEGQRNLWLPAFLSWFAAGLFGAHTVVDAHRPQPSRTTRWVRQVCDQPGSCFVLAFALLLIISTPLGGPYFGAVATPAEAITKNLVYALIGLLLVLPCALGSMPPLMDRILAHPAGRYLGRISYGIFCLHLIVLYGVFRLLDVAYFTGQFWLVFIVTMAGSIAAAAAAHRLVEIPAQRLRNIRPPMSRASRDPSAPARTS